MSWTLSCLSLREHYDEVALYTDQKGYDVFINKLHLPYTEVNVVYDKNLCLPHHAFARVVLNCVKLVKFNCVPFGWRRVR